jgi:RNA 2',3'-cyclic 3'-phosphodiesterase
MKRLFIAIKIQPDPAFMAQFRQLKLSLRHERIKWVEEHNIHLTLKFLGETEEERIPAIIGEMERVAAATKPFRYSLKKTGIFGSTYEPRVIWVGIEPYDALVMLMKAVHEAMKKAGFGPDRQNLVPHLTLGRINYLQDRPLFQATLEQFRNIASAELNAGSMILFESILKKEGPEYRAIQVVQFAIKNT